MNANFRFLRMSCYIEIWRRFQIQGLGTRSLVSSSNRARNRSRIFFFGGGGSIVYYRSRIWDYIQHFLNQVINPFQKRTNASLHDIANYGLTKMLFLLADTRCCNGRADNVGNDSASKLKMSTMPDTILENGSYQS